MSARKRLHQQGRGTAHEMSKPQIRLSQHAHTLSTRPGFSGAMRPVDPAHQVRKLRPANPLDHKIDVMPLRMTHSGRAAIIPTGPVPAYSSRVRPAIVDNLQNPALDVQLPVEGSPAGDWGWGAEGSSRAGESSMWVALAGQLAGDARAQAARDPGAGMAPLSGSWEGAGLSIPSVDDILSIHGGKLPVQRNRHAAYFSRHSGRYHGAAARDHGLLTAAAEEDELQPIVPVGEQDAAPEVQQTARDARAATATSIDSPDALGKSIGTSAFIISICVIFSRITGFIRTWSMGFAMGTTLLSSSYQVACNLPNQLYELVMGGMLVTAFLPVYVSLRKREGQARASAYASTLLGLVVLVLGAASLVCMVFSPQVVYTQMFLNPSGDRELVTFFFRFFAIQLLLYGVSAVLGGLLNAGRDYLWSSAAPIANNIVVIAVMVAYVFIAPTQPDRALQMIAIGTPVGVLTQMLIMIPPLAKHRIRVRPRIDLRDPALRETLSLGLATIVVTVCSFVTVSVQNASAMAVTTAGSSVLFYARQWFTLPYAFLSVPLSTTLFTELSDMAAGGDRRPMMRTIAMGCQQSLFFMVPFALYLMVFAAPLVSLFQAGAFTSESVDMVASYLQWMAVSLPFYAIFMFMQKVFSAIRRLRFYAVVNIVVSVVQVVFTLLLPLGFGGWEGVGINGIAFAQTLFFALGDVGCFVFLLRYFGRFELGGMLRCFVTLLVLGAVGAVLGAAVLQLLVMLLGPYSGSLLRTFVYVVISGLISLAATYGLALLLRVPESAFIRNLIRRRS